MPLIRYPGSKAKLAPAIIRHFPPQMRMPLWMDHSAWEYREPFFGSGAIGFEILAMLPPRCTAWVNDKDYWLVCMWKAVQDTPDELCEKIEEFDAGNADAFYQFKMEDGRTDIDPLLAGFRKLALHGMSWSGLGAKAGGPLGGKDQSNAKYPSHCRWNPYGLQDWVQKLHRLLKPKGRPKAKITCRDFPALFVDGRADAYYYLDPPYVEKGEELYKHAFELKDHERLAKCLKETPAPWSLSYDNHSLVHKLYDGFKVIPVDVKYSVAVESETRRKNQEILIVSEGATVSA